MIIRKGTKLITNRSTEIEGRLRAFSMLEQACIPADHNWRELTLCNCSVCDRIEIIKHKLVQCQRQPDAESHQKLLKLLVLQDSKKEQATLNIRIAETCFFSQSKCSSYCYYEGGRVKVKIRPSIKELTDAMLKTNHSGIWLFVDNDLNSRLLCKNEFYYLLRPGSKTRPLRAAVSLQNYVDSGLEQPIHSTDFQYHPLLQLNPAFIQAKKHVLFNDPITSPLESVQNKLEMLSYEIYHFVLKMHSTRILKCSYHVAEEDGRLILINCLGLKSELQLPQIKTKDVIINHPPNHQIINEIESMYESEKSSLKHIKEIDGYSSQKKSAQTYCRLFGGSEEDYLRLLDRKDFYSVSTEIILNKHKQKQKRLPFKPLGMSFH